MAEKPSGWLAVLGEKLGFFTGSQLGEQSIFDKVQLNNKFLLVVKKCL